MEAELNFFLEHLSSAKERKLKSISRTNMQADILVCLVSNKKTNIVKTKKHLDNVLNTYYTVHTFI